ncbi:MAG: UDP-N-acetylglucosamine 2-epimerase (non-hydrolyzing) [Ottowia sp.]|uniref:non-hydrolyzing UDP-N-acetylglucosamine 2-epimerase n=1 Tax=Ottowia sp. TaxID=1898956 RepID=UPI003C766EDF
MENRVLLVSGTRPEIIKLAPVYQALCASEQVQADWLHTGQHGEMATQMLSCFDIRPDIAFAREGSDLLSFSQGCRAQLDAVLENGRYDAVIVQGDTESAFLGALAGFYRQVPVAHVEAGLRTHNLQRPFPEEGLRQMIGRIAAMHFPPTGRSRASLLAEGVPEERIQVTGNTVVDAQRWVCRRHGIRRQVKGRGHLLVTMHRREHWGDDVEQVCQAIAQLAREQPDLQVLFPVHLNPVVQTPVHALLAGLPNVQLTTPLDYLGMQQALADAWLVLTDSGGLQEEAPTFGVPLLVLRNETERPEAVEAGCAEVVGTGKASILAAVRRLSLNNSAYRRMQGIANPFGDGTAAQRIAHWLCEVLDRQKSRYAASGGSHIHAVA